MLLKVGTQVSNALKITLTKFHQHLSCGSQVFKGWHKRQRQRRLTTRSRLCYSPRRKLIVEDKKTRTQKHKWKQTESKGVFNKTVLPRLLVGLLRSCLRYRHRRPSQPLRIGRGREWRDNRPPFGRQTALHHPLLPLEAQRQLLRRRQLTEEKLQVNQSFSPTPIVLYLKPHS